jgi:hypothetical protein
MKRILFPLMPALILALALPGAALADSKVTGAGQTDSGAIKFNVSAHAQAGGAFTAASGVVSVTRSSPGFEVSYRVNVDCLSFTTPTTATIGGAVSSVSPYPNTSLITVGDRLLVAVRDGGNQSSPGPVDAFTVFSAAPVPCGQVQLFPFPNVTQGNVGISAPAGI